MADVTVANTAPGVAGKTLACHDADGLTTGIWTFANPLALKGGAPGNQTWRLSASGSGNVGLLADGTGAGLSMNTAGAAIFSGDISEKSRATPLGHWIDVPFSAANFTADIGTWTIGTVATNAYTLIGKTLVYQLALQSCTLSASPTSLVMALPAGVTTPKLTTGTVSYANAGVAAIGTIYTSPGGTSLTFIRDLAFTPWLTNVGGTTIYGFIIVPIL